MPICMTHAKYFQTACPACWQEPIPEEKPPPLAPVSCTALVGDLEAALALLSRLKRAAHERGDACLEIDMQRACGPVEAWLSYERSQSPTDKGQGPLPAKEDHE